MSNIYKLEKKATPGPYRAIKWPDGSVVLEGRWFNIGQVFARKAGEGASAWKAKDPVATAQYLAYCRNNFRRLLEAAAKMQEKLATGVAATNDECLAWAKLISDLEGVKT